MVNNLVGATKETHQLVGIFFAELLKECRSAVLKLPTLDFKILSTLVGHRYVYATTVRF